MATALTPSTSGVLMKEIAPNLGLKELFVELPATVDDADTFTIDLANYGGTTFVGHWGIIHTASNSILAAEANTTAVTGTSLVVTIGGSTDNKKRSLFLYYY